MDAEDFYNECLKAWCITKEEYGNIPPSKLKGLYDFELWGYDGRVERTGEGRVMHLRVGSEDMSVLWNEESGAEWLRPPNQAQSLILTLSR